MALLPRLRPGRRGQAPAQEKHLLGAAGQAPSSRPSRPPLALALACSWPRRSLRPPTPVIRPRLTSAWPPFLGGLPCPGQGGPSRPGLAG